MRCGSVIIFSLLILLSSLFADGVIVIPTPQIPPDEFGPNPFVLEYHHVKVRIENEIAHVEIEEAFKNISNRRVEAQYIFPIIGESYITDFEMVVGDEVLKPKILEKDEARKLYMDIVMKMKDPALLEFMNHRTLSLRIYPFEPQESRRIILKYVQILKKKRGLYRFDYPLKIEGILAEPMKNVEIDVTIRNDNPIADFYSPNFEFDVIERDEKKLHLIFRRESLKPTDDLALFYETGKEEFDASTMFHREENEGFFMLSLLPTDLPGERALPKNIVIVMDISGSMAGEKIEQAKRAVKFVLENLGREDRFSLIFFNSSVLDLTNGKLLPASEAESMVKKVDEIEAGGGTNIYEALKRALEILKDHEDENNFVVFVTDGIPTVGLKDPRKIVENLGDIILKNEINLRIFPFGVGYDVNTNLLDSLSLRNGGYSEYVVENVRLDDSIQSFYEKIKTPVLRDVHVEISGVRTFDLHPERIYNIFSNSPIRIFGRYEGCGTAEIRLEGIGQNDEKFSKRWLQTFPCDFEEANNPFIAKIWAQKKIADLALKIKLGEVEYDDVKDEIINLSKKYGIINEFTSYLITQKDEEKPPVLKYEESGKSAVMMSKGLFFAKVGNVLRSTDEVSKEYKNVAGKTFVRSKDGFWVDLDFRNENVLKVKFLSDAYMKLLDDEKLARYLSVGEKVKINYKGFNLIIGEEGIEKVSELPNELK